MHIIAEYNGRPIVVDTVARTYRYTHQVKCDTAGIITKLIELGKFELATITDEEIAEALFMYE